MRRRAKHPSIFRSSNPFVVVSWMAFNQVQPPNQKRHGYLEGGPMSFAMWAITYLLAPFCIALLFVCHYIATGYWFNAP